MDKVEVNDTESVQLQAGLVGLSMATEGQVKFEDLWDEKKLKFVPRKMCELLCGEDLYQVALCSKSLDEKVFALLKKYEETLLRVNLHSLYNLGLAEVKAMLCCEESTKNPYSGLSISLAGHQDRRAYKREMHGLLDEFLKLVVSNMETKVVRFKGAGWIHSSLMMKVLKAVAQHVKTVEITDLTTCKFRLGPQRPKIWQQVKLEKLSDLKLDHISSVSAEKAIFEILTNAPNLRKLDGLAHPDWFANTGNSHLLKGKVIQKLELYFSRIWRMRKAYEDFVAEKPQLRELTTNSKYFSWENPESSDEHCAVSNIFSSLLQSSKDSLEILEINLTTLFHFQTANLFSKLPNLTKLVIHGNSFATRLDELIYLNLLDYPTLFPNLKRVELVVGCDWHKEDTDFDAAGWKAHVGASVTELVITYDSNEWNFGDSYVIPDKDGWAWKPFEQFSQVFPNVRHICLNELVADQLTGRLSALWTVWPEIESITLAKIEGRGYKMKEGIDHAILGVDKETVKILRKEGTTGFNPVGPSILNMKKLKKLRLELILRNYIVVYSDSSSDDSDSDGGASPPLEERKPGSGDAFISDVAGRLALSKMPELTLEVYEVRAPDYRPLKWFSVDHLKPFVKVRVWQKALRIQDIGQ